ncbi:FecR family protein [Niastella caeni]|nr:FecR domain-containing protein [Niastella caeni]
MDRTAFRELLIKYSNGTATAAEKALVDHWYELLYDYKLPALKQEELDTIEQEMWAHIEQAGNIVTENTTVPYIKPAVRRKRLYYIAAAAIITGLITGGWIIFFSSPETFSFEKNRQQRKLAESSNNTAAPKRISLADGSYVVLQPASKIAYANDINSNKREVFLEGEAFFQVTKDPARPFYVYTNELVTKVLGTSFDVRAFPRDNTIKVMVHTGKVTVYQRKNDQAEQELARSNATIIIPNQQVLFNRHQASITRSISEQPLAVITNGSNNNGQLVFTDTPASDVLMAIQKAYGIPIVFDEELLSRCSFTGAFTNESFFERINLVCKAIEATYEQTDGQVIITGHDCEK